MAYYYCDDCDRGFSTARALRQHNGSVGHQKNLWNYWCHLCDWGCDILRQMEIHDKDVHFWCKVHDKWCGNENNYRAHMNSTAHVGRTVPCRVCSSYFRNVADLTLHLESGSCDGGFTRYDVDKLVHSRDHANQITRRPITYGDWTEPAGEANIWATEDGAWNGWGYECNFCDNTYNSLGRLNAHITLRHAPKRTKEIYFCPGGDCRKGFSLFSGLMQHLNVKKCGIVGGRGGMQKMLGY